MNHLSLLENELIFNEPLVQFADGNDTIFIEYKTIIDTSHLTPREALARAVGLREEAIEHAITRC